MIKKKEFEEQITDLNDLEKTVNDMNFLLKKIESEENDKDIDVDIENLVYLHLNYCNIEWHVERVHELIKKMIGKYSKYSKKQLPK